VKTAPVLVHRGGMDVRQVETELTCSAGGHPIQKGIRFTDNRAAKIF
jgi:hypothetical protein